LAKTPFLGVFRSAKVCTHTSLVQILDLLGLTPTWYLLASISRRELATHQPWTLSRHGCYVALSNALDNAKTVQILRHD